MRFRGILSFYRYILAYKAKRLRLYLFILSLLFVAFVEEAYIACVRNFYRNFYTATIIFNITGKRTGKLRNISILTVIKEANDLENYRLALDTLECYALHHRYGWKLIDLSMNQTLNQLCPQSDFMFTRHCVTAQILSEISDEWVLFVDSDMGVINPNRLIEEWIDDNFALIFYDRIFNFEVMAGSYLVKNSEYSRNFLRFWADYERELPKSFHGTDNGALHNVLSKLLEPDKINERKNCEKIWNMSRSYDDLYLYEACIRSFLGRTWINKVKILEKGTSWSRDTWLTNSLWSKNDFILHGWQTRKIDGQMFGSWPSPFTSHFFNMSLCRSNTAGLNWQYKNTFVQPENKISYPLNWIIQRTSKQLHEAQLKVKELLVQ